MKLSTGDVVNSVSEVLLADRVVHMKLRCNVQPLVHVGELTRDGQAANGMDDNGIHYTVGVKQNLVTFAESHGANLIQARTNILDGYDDTVPRAATWVHA